MSERKRIEKFCKRIDGLIIVADEEEHDDKRPKIASSNTEIEGIRNYLKINKSTKLIKFFIVYRGIVYRQIVYRQIDKS